MQGYIYVDERDGVLKIDTDGATHEVRTTDDLRSVLDGVVEKHGKSAEVYCSSSVDFPEEYTQDQMTIALCHAIHRL